MIGRMMLFMLLQFLMLIPGPGHSRGLRRRSPTVLSGFHLPVFAVTAWLLLVAELPLWLFLLAWMFERFDPSTETPRVESGLDRIPSGRRPAALRWMLLLSARRALAAARGAA